MATGISPDRALEIVSRFADHHVVAVGDFFLDRYIYGRVAGVSPEMPVLRIVEECREYRAGAAGNLAANLASLGARVSAVGVIGEDEAGQLLLQQLHSNGVDTGGLLTDGSRITGTLTRFVGSGGRSPSRAGRQHHLRVDRENTSAVSPQTSRRALENLSNLLSSADSLFLADYDEHPARIGLLAPAFTRQAIENGRRSGALCCGTSRHHPDDLHGLDYLLANEAEAARLGLRSREDLDAFAEGALRRMQLHGLCVTLGKDGAYCFAGGRPLLVDAPACDVIDPCGAGDTFAAAFLLSLRSGATPGEALRLAVRAGTLAVQMQGTEPVRAAQLIQQIRYQGRGPGKLREREELVEILDQARSRQRIVFTNGYFDLFHSGHVQLLTRAKEYGDILVVGVNSDRSTAANKGSGRPVLSEAHRVEILAALECVDYITVFDELTPINLLRRLRPHVLVKGGNYAPEQVVGKDIVESTGGVVEVVGYFGDLTTTGLIRSVKGASDGTRGS